MSKKIIYITESQFLKEFGENGDKNTLAMPTSNSQNMSNSIDNARKLNPSSDNVIVDTSMFDSSSNNDPVQIDVKAKNGQEAQNKINKMMSSNPQLKTMSAKGNLMANVNMECEIKTKKMVDEELNKLNKAKILRENVSSKITKKELENYQF